MLKWLIAIVTLATAAASPAAAGPALLFEVESGKVLYAEEADQSWHPASLTKMMTAYLVFEALKAGSLKLEDKLVCSQPAVEVSPSKIGLPLGGEITVDLALRALIVKSANDMAIMLGEKLAGTEAAFAVRMTETAKRLAMTRTNFANASGLPDARQVTSARDMALLSRAIIRDFPEHAALFSMPNMKIGNRRLGSHNGLLKTFEGADGMKTGFICDSGFNIVASATRDGRRLVAVVLGEPSADQRNVRAAALLQHGFETLGWKTYFSSDTLESMAVSQGATVEPANVRKLVTAWACGNRPVKVRKAKSTKKTSSKKSTKKKSSTKAATGTAATTP